jgi:putative membrane protein insertion efficiency factor
MSVAASRGINPYGTGSNTNSIAVATTAARQLLEICKKRCLNLQNSICTIPHYNRSLRIAASAALVAGGMVAIARHHIPSTTKQRLHRGLWRNELAESQDDNKAIPDGDTQAGDDAEPRTEEDETVMTSAMVATIGVYKNFISPLLPPACRFVPTCSQYGVQAIKEYGPNKGVILTSWRLLRCSPFGGKGYDPPKWPPVSYTYSSY